MSDPVHEPFHWWFPFYFAFLWCTVTLTVGRFNGWYWLSKTYPLKGPIPKTPRWNSCSIPNLSLRNCVKIALDERGMYFQLWFFFRCGNPAIFIPWSEISACRSKIFFRPSIKLTFKSYPAVSFHFHRKRGEKFVKAAGNRFPEILEDKEDRENKEAPDLNGPN